MADIAASSSTESTIIVEEYDDCQLNKVEIWILESIKENLKGEVISSLQSDYDIYRVPTRLHKLKPEAYTPQSVSIGPLHYDEKHLRTMQTHKLRYLNRLLHRRPNGKTLDDYVKAVNRVEEEARKCYSESIGLEKDEFVKMMVIDGCFILEFLRILVSNDSWRWVVMSDLIKLENQLPFFVLEHLCGLIFELPPQYSFNDLIYDGLLACCAGVLLGPTTWDDVSKKFIADIFPKGGAKHFLDLLRCALLPSPKPKPEDCGRKRRTPCASKLESSGVKFKKLSISPSKSSLFDIDFDKKKGVLTIPTISIYDVTEVALRNLIAFEQGLMNDTIDYFTAYAAFMDGLIDTPRDVELLEKKGNIKNHLSNPKDVVSLFNDIVKYVAVKVPYFSPVIKDVEEYHNKTWNKWRASLMQNYFNTPWALISFLAALLLLILTIVQTICSFSNFK